MKYGLIGEKLGCSFSKEIHEKLGRYEYELKELAEDELESFLKTADFEGINVTVPYKEMVIPYLDRVDEIASSVGSVNTIIKRNGQLSWMAKEYSVFSRSTCSKGQEAFL